MTPVAAVLVTRNSMAYLQKTLDSIQGQSRKPDILIAIDDRSTDDTVDLLSEAGFTVRTSTSSASDLSTRIAQNFVHGIRVAEQHGAEVVVLGDHDDVWHSDRVAHQSSILEANLGLAMVASDGFLIDGNGVALPGTIRSTFPIPDNFAQLSLHRQLGYALRHSIATGGASAIRPARFSQSFVPSGWLHDRWWSLVSVREQGFLADPTSVIDYRISSDQQVGLNAADQNRSLVWWSTRARRLRSSTGRAKDIASLLRS